MRARLLCPPASIRRQSYLRAQSSSSGLTERARELLRSELTPRIDEILHDAGELESVEEVERMACELLLPFQSADAPPELASALVEAVGGSEAAAAPHLLTAFSVLGRGAVGSVAAASGRQSRFEGLVGRLEPRAAARVIDGAAEVLQVRFERPETGEYQLGAVFLEREDGGGAALAGGVTAPTPEPGRFIPSPGGARARTVSLDEVRRRIEKALARTAELELAVDREPLVAEMEADGVELGDQAALDAWMEDFNARPPEERDRVVGPALERMGPVPPLGDPEPTERPRPSGPSKAQRRGKRKQARGARKRNR